MAIQITTATGDQTMTDDVHGASNRHRNIETLQRTCKPPKRLGDTGGTTGTGMGMNALEEIYNAPGGPSIVLRMLRPAPDELSDTKEISMLRSDQFEQLTVAGVIDYIGIRRENPIISRHPNVPEVAGNPSYGRRVA